MLVRHTLVQMGPILGPIFEFNGSDIRAVVKSLNNLVVRV